MSRAALHQRLLDLLLVLSVVVLTGCADAMAIEEGQVTRETVAAAQAQQSRYDDEGNLMPIRKKEPRPSAQ